MLTRSLFLLLLLVNGCNVKFLRFVERCPTRNERQKRSIYSECVLPEVYHCARDDDLKLVEICNEAIQLPPGNYPRYTSYTDRIFYDICPDNRHQPWPVKSNEIADCEVKKSNCNDVGQLPCDHGSTTDDVTCNCDFTNGFVIRGSSTCCSPSSTDDCYCEYRPCQNSSQELNSDYKCIDKCTAGYERKRGEEFCSIIGITNRTETTTQITATGHEIGTLFVKREIIFEVAISVSTVLLICLLIVVFHILRSYDIRPNLNVYQLLDAAAKGNLAVIKRYYVAKFDMNLADYDKRTALHVAVSANKASIVKYLIQECNVKINLKDRWGRTALDEAVKKRKNDLLIFFEIRDKDFADTISREWKTFRLMRAGFLGDTDELKRLHEDGFDMEMRDYDGQTALHFASAYGHLDTVRFLIEICKVKADIPDRDGRKPLEEAGKRYNAQNSHNYDSILVILRNAPKSEDDMANEQSESAEDIVNDQSEEKNVIYEVNDAIAKGNSAKLKHLGWWNMDTGDYLKETPLHVAAAKGQLKLIKYLVEEKKVSLFVRNSFWETPIRLARKKCKYWKKKLRIPGTSAKRNKKTPQGRWEDYGPDLQSDSDSDDENKEDKDIHHRIKVFKAVSKYLYLKMREQIEDTNYEEDKSLSRYNDDERTFLFINNTWRGDIAAVKRYLATKETSNLIKKADYSKRTALHIAVSEGHYHLVIYFLRDLKVEFDCKDRWDNTPRDDAKRNKDHKMIEIIDKYSKKSY